MFRGRNCFLRVCGIILFFSGSAFASDGGSARTFWWNLDHLELVKQKWLSGDEAITLAANGVINNANIYKARGPYSVMDKDEIPPSGDKHDFLSYGYYWWPNPDTNDGLPWIHRDGYGNPDNAIDFGPLSYLTQSMINLSLAYYLTDDESYAEHAAYLLRTWFLDEATKMNPSTYFSQVIPGVSEGTCEVVGIANTFQFILEGAGILERSSFWSDTDKEGLQQWCRDYFDFIETEPICDRQREDPSNHGSNYDFLAALLSLYSEEEATAEQKILSYIQDRMPGQISPDGSNPLEMRRTNNLLYHCYNLQIMSRVASLGDHFGSIDLWNYETEDGRGLRMALEFLIPYMIGEKEWDYWPAGPFSPSYDRFFILLRHTAVGYNSFTIEGYAQQVPGAKYSYFNIIYPWFAIVPIPGDFKPDGDVDLFDWTVFASAWQSIPGDGGWNPICDISEPSDNIINSQDLAAFVGNWLDSR